MTSVDIIIIPEGMHRPRGDLTSFLQNAHNDSAAKVNNWNWMLDTEKDGWTID